MIRGLGYAALLGLVAAALGLAWAAWRIFGYERVEDRESLERKAAALERMQGGASRAGDRPNVVLILFDDLGYGDLGAFGSEALETPRIDALAAEGIALDHFYAAAPVCSPSRAGLLTGRWPVRTTLSYVVFPTGSPLDRLQRLLSQPVRLPSDEITLADALRAGGYATAAIGKWHLGDRSPSLPRDLGFDRYFGVLYSNDMSPLELFRDEEVIEPDPVDQTTLTRRYTEEAVAFIEQHRDEPFFLYVAHTFPHIPLYASPEQAGRSPAGRYGDVIADLDRSVGEIVDALDRLALADRTLVLVTSDNGPWFQGSQGSVRGRKGTSFEGGMRVPFLARFPGRIPGGVRSDAVASGVDVFPTALALAGVPLPGDRMIDGVDLLPVLEGGAPRAPRPIFYYWGDDLQAIRLGRFKWHARHGIAYGGPGFPVAPLIPRGPWLFDLERDPDESYDVRVRENERFTRFERIAANHERIVRDNPRGWVPVDTGRGPAGR